MKIAWMACVLATLAITACATPGAQLGYAEFLPNTNEDPAWAHNSPPAAVPGSAGLPRSSQPNR